MANMFRRLGFLTFLILLISNIPSYSQELAEKQKPETQNPGAPVADIENSKYVQEQEVQSRNDIQGLIQKNPKHSIHHSPHKNKKDKKTEKMPETPSSETPSKETAESPAKTETPAEAPKQNVSAELIPNDPLYSSKGSWGQTYDDLWGIKAIGVESVWDYYQGDGIKIAVVDTGVLMNHQDIAQNIWTNPFEIAGNGKDDDGNGYVDDVHGWDFVGKDNNPTDENGHGTHVAGIAAGALNNGRGITGVAPKAKIIPIRVLNENGEGEDSDVAAGIRYAVDMGADVINLSLGSFDTTPEDEQKLREVIAYAKSKGAIVVAAAGNESSLVDMPASIDGAIAVGATTPFGTDAFFSNFGSDLLISAPGQEIVSLGSRSTHIGDRVRTNYYRASGTSMATPFVSGAVALILDKYPDATFEDVLNLLAAGADDMAANVDGIADEGWDPITGFGELNVAKSLELRPEDVRSYTENSQYKKFDDSQLESKFPVIPEIPFVPATPALPKPAYPSNPYTPQPFVPQPDPYVWGGTPFIPSLPSFGIRSFNSRESEEALFSWRPRRLREKEEDIV